MNSSLNSSAQRIPCWLTNRDVLTPVRGMVEHLLDCQDVGAITIVDCGSTYPPLLEWYERRCPVSVIRTANLGSQAPWHFLAPSEGFYFESDSDLDLTGVPNDLLGVLRDGLLSDPQVRKAGLSLRLDDLPADNPLTAKVVAHESQFWRDRRDEWWFRADIDTTAAVYRGDSGWSGYGPSLRSAPPYAARHLPWYLDPGALSEEWDWYFRHLDPRVGMWGPQIRGLMADGSSLPAG